MLNHCLQVKRRKNAVFQLHVMSIVVPYYQNLILKLNSRISDRLLTIISSVLTCTNQIIFISHQKWLPQKNGKEKKDLHHQRKH